MLLCVFLNVQGLVLIRYVKTRRHGNDYHKKKKKLFLYFQILEAGGTWYTMPGHMGDTRSARSRGNKGYICKNTGCDLSTKKQTL